MWSLNIRSARFVQVWECHSMILKCASNHFPMFLPLISSYNLNSNDPSEQDRRYTRCDRFQYGFKPSRIVKLVNHL